MFRYSHCQQRFLLSFSNFPAIFNDFHSTVSVLHRCALNNNSQYQSQRINNDMPLNAFYLLTSIKALTFTAYKGILYRLSIYNTNGWLLIFYPLLYVSFLLILRVFVQSAKLSSMKKSNNKQYSSWENQLAASAIGILF